MIRMIEPRHTFNVGETILRVFHANKNDGLPHHTHSYPHATICHSGSIIVRKEGKELAMTKDTQPVDLIENEWHEIEALEDETVFVNIHAGLLL